MRIFQKYKEYMRFDILFFQLAKMFFIFMAIYATLDPIASKIGLDQFLNQQDFYYSEGIFTGHFQRNKYGKYFYIHLKDNQGNLTPYQCSHSAMDKKPRSTCLNVTHDEIKTYLNKPAKIAWLPQKDFLWFHNPYRQIVKLEIDGKVIDMQKTIKHNIEDSPIIRGFSVFLSIFIVISSISAYFLMDFVVKKLLKDKNAFSKTESIGEN